MRLQEFARPAQDNGFGIHFGRDLRQVALDTYVPKMVDLRIKWCLVPHTDELQLQRAATAIWGAGIMPVARWVCQIDQSNLDFARFATILKSQGIPPYIQIFNEPGDPREWKSGTPNFDQFVQRWIQCAGPVVKAGGFPGIQVLDPQELRTLLRALKSARADAILDHVWFCPHPYGANHPPSYPYDSRNQQDHPGATVQDDDTTVLSFLEFAQVFSEEVGSVPPFIAGEGGWQFRNYDDSRYPLIDDNLHAEYHTALLNCFQSGTLPNGDPLPDYMFAFCPWILFGPETDAWYSWTTGTRQQTVIAIQSLPAFTRRFDWQSPTYKSIPRLLLFGSPDEQSTRSMLLAARKYISKNSLTVGFNAEDASHAQNVTIVGDTRAVSLDVEAYLKNAGCAVERLNGDQYAVDTILSERMN